MNVSFLSSTGTFGGLRYNMKKVEMNSADLIYTQNFDGLKHLSSPSTSDYMEYLKAWSDRNSRVKNTQFHVAISVRGREKSEEDLLRISKEWLAGMGYGDMPALFFFHRDTDNNHIHIVTSRIDRNGRKIKDNNEIRRGLSLIRKLNGIDLSEKARRNFYNLENYKISSRSQYSSLWGSLGYRVKIKDEKVLIYKEGLQVMTMDISSVDRQVEKDTLSEKRATEIRDLLAKYRKDLSIYDLQVLLKEKHQLEFVFYGKKEAPYGYAVLDHRDQKVYKGSDILNLEELLSNNRIYSDTEQVDRVHAFARHMLKESRMTSDEFRKKIKEMGMNIYKGDIFYKRFNLGSLDDDITNKLWYNDRLAKASNFSVQSKQELEALAKHYRVESRDIDSKVIVDDKLLEGKDLKSIYEEAKGSDDFLGTLSSYRVSIVSHEGEHYLIDEDNGHIEIVGAHTQFEKNRLEHDWENAQDGEVVSSMLGLNVYDDIETSSVDNSLRKRKRK